MATSEAERVAKRHIEEAINEFRIAFAKEHPEATQGTVVDWVVIAAEVKPDLEDPEEDITAYNIISSQGTPWYRAVGLLAAGRHFMNHDGPENE